LPVKAVGGVGKAGGGVGEGEGKVEVGVVGEEMRVVVEVGVVGEERSSRSSRNRREDSTKQLLPVKRRIYKHSGHIQSH
jgi:hypothetical protein